MEQGTEELKKALKSGTNYNIIGRTDHISAFPDIIGENFPEIFFPLGFTVGKHTFILTECAFNVTLPQVKTETFPVNTGGSKIIDTGNGVSERLFQSKMVLFSGNICDIIAALGSGDNIAVSCKLEISIFNRGTAKLQILSALAQRRHLASGKKSVFHDHFPVVVVFFQIEMFFFVFCGYI